MSEVEAAVTVEVVEVLQEHTVVEEVSSTSHITESGVEVVVETSPVVEILETVSPEMIVETSEVVTVVTEGVQGPPGRPGLSEDDVVYAKRIDMVDASVLYRGEAVVGSSPSDAVWRIRRVTLLSVGELVDVTEQWAGGTADFVHKWDDRATLTYV